MRKVQLSCFIFLMSTACFAQSFSNKGKDFWLGYGYHVRFVTNGGGGGINGQEMVLYFATENIPNTTTCIKMGISGLGYVENITNISEGTIVTSKSIPKSGTQNARHTSEGLLYEEYMLPARGPLLRMHIFLTAMFLAPRCLSQL